MREDIRDALECASFADTAKRRKPSAIRFLMLAVLRELPDDMTVRELRDGLDEDTTRDA